MISRRPIQKLNSHNDHRTVINGILWVVRTGAPWRDMPERYGKWESVATRFYRWQKAGIWNQILKHLQAIADQEGKLDWEVHYVDGTVIRAHQHAAGGILGRSRSVSKRRTGEIRSFSRWFQYENTPAL